MRKYKAASFPQAARIAYKTFHWDSKEKEVLRLIGENALTGSRFGYDTVYWCESPRMGFLFSGSPDWIEISRIYTK